MKRREFLTTAVIGAIRPSVFILGSDSGYREILRGIFGKLIEEGDYENGEYFVRLEGEGYLETAHLEDRNGNKKFEDYEDWGHLKGMWYLAENGETKVNYAKILFGRLWFNSTEIHGAFDSGYFAKADKEDVLGKLHRMDVMNRNYFEKGECRIESGDVKRFTNIPSKPGSKIVVLLEDFAEHFKIDINPEIKQVKNINTKIKRIGIEGKRR